jgi:thiamine biosynthesis lipoprotein
LKKRWSEIQAAWLLWILLAAPVLGEPAAWPEDVRPVMGTAFRVLIRGEEGPAARGAIEACFQIFDRVDRTMSEWREDSPVSEINRQAGIAPVRVPEELFEILKASRRVSELSHGAFDVTWAALRGLWRFDGSNRVPSREEIAARVGLVQWEDLVLDPEAKTVFLRRKGMALGLGGIAKGYALDQAAAELRRRGFPDFLLDAGGQVYAGGSKGGEPWRVGIRDPRGTAEDYFASIAVTDASLSTSGDYEHYFMIEGTRYHHIIDPETGMPARLTRGATVLAPSATLADAYSTAAFVLGPERGLAFAREAGFDLVLVDAEGNVVMTDRIREQLKAAPVRQPVGRPAN